MATDNHIINFTAVDIDKYHKGLLSPDKRHDLEKAALDDPFLADALEGYDLAGIDAQADISELKIRLAERVERTKVIPINGGKQNSLQWLKVAAMIVVIGGAGLLVYQFAFNKKKGEVENIAKFETTNTSEAKPTDTGNTTVPGVGGKEPSTSVKKTVEPKTENRVTVENKSSSGTASKNADMPNLSKVDSTASHFTTLDKSAAPVVTNLPNGADEKNNQPVGSGKNPEKKEITREETKNKTNGFYKQDGDKDVVKEQSIVQQEDQLKKNSSVSTNRKADEQYFRNNATNTFRGQVTDVSNVGVPFAKVTNAQDNNAGTYTDARGFFNLTYPDTVLNVQVRSVGFENNNVQLHNNVTNNRVVLQDDRKSQAEVVVSNQKPNTAARSRDANMKVEEPEPADGWENYDTYLTNNLNVPDDFKPKQIKDAAVEISFEVDNKGEPVNIKIEKSLCLQCDKEAIRLVKEGPKWKRNANKKGRTTVTVPFNNAVQ